MPDRPSKNSSSAAPVNPTRRTSPALRSFGFLTGLVLGLALCKFGNPVILDRLIDAPQTTEEILVQSWPARWGYLLLVPLAVFGFVLAKPPPRLPRVVLALPCVWFAWQMLSGTQTVDRALTSPTLWHFGTCIVFLGLGCLTLRQLDSLTPVWLGLALPWLYVISTGFEQHFGGLEETRKQFYANPNWQSMPPDYIKRIASDRIFSTLVYPNALAGAILIYTPVALTGFWNFLKFRGVIPLGTVLGFWAYTAAACLVWSGSKSGWLIGLILIGVTLFQLDFSRRIKVGLAAALLVCGLAGFFIKFSGYFKKGATSVSARFDYWSAGLQTAASHPFLGTGPGTFSVAYKKLKRPESEMAKLTHNDYLEQASDSGLVGFLAYSGMFLGCLAWVYRYRFQKKPDSQRFGIWLGLLAFALQSFVEFPLYIPALSWPAFLFLGYLLGVNVNEPARSAS